MVTLCVGLDGEGEMLRQLRSRYYQEVTRSSESIAISHLSAVIFTQLNTVILKFSWKACF